MCIHRLLCWKISALKELSQKQDTGSVRGWGSQRDGWFKSKGRPTWGQGPCLYHLSAERGWLEYCDKKDSEANSRPSKFCALILLFKWDDCQGIRRQGVAMWSTYLPSLQCGSGWLGSIKIYHIIDIACYFLEEETFELSLEISKFWGRRKKADLGVTLYMISYIMHLGEVSKEARTGVKTMD